MRRTKDNINKSKQIIKKVNHSVLLALSSAYGQDKTVINDMHSFFQQHVK